VLNKVKSASVGAKTKSCSYFVSGTHCHSCELIIEKEISKLSGIESVFVSTKDQKVVIQYQKNQPSVSQLNNIFKENGYTFSPRPVKGGIGGGFKPDICTSILISFGIIIVFYFLQKISIFSSFNVNSTSATPAFFFFGLLAGFSTCAALVGSIVFTLSRRGLASVIFFNLGRLILFTIFGGILGYFGSFFRLSITANVIVTIFVSLIMIVLGLQMLNFKFLNFINFSLPKSITSKIISSSQASFVFGGLTFFLPCGFTLTAQSLALGSSSWLNGALIMMFFALGTLVPLTIIGITGAKSLSRPITSKYFSQIAGILILVFAIYNVSSQFTILGFFPSFQNSVSNFSSIVPIIDGKYVLKMDASSTGYTPNTFTVKAGQPIRWEITDRGTSGCTNAIISHSLFDGPIYLVPGTTSIKEFTAPTTPGTYRFSCWMGMISGTIVIVN